jgi:hypothetical protein
VIAELPAATIECSAAFREKLAYVQMDVQSYSAARPILISAAAGMLCSAAARLVTIVDRQPVSLCKQEWHASMLMRRTNYLNPGMLHPPSSPELPVLVSSMSSLQQQKH